MNSTGTNDHCVTYSTMRRPKLGIILLAEFPPPDYVTASMIVSLLIAVGFAALILRFFVQDWYRLYSFPHLRTPTGLPAELPLISFLIPARNEERNIERCVRGALAQDYPNCEVIVLDDGSVDRTGAILAGLSADRRLRVLRGRPLPAGWVGKSYACQQLSDAARGEWLLFLDADGVPEVGLATALLAHAQRQQLDLVTLFPFLELGSFWERLVLPPFLALLTAFFPYERAARPDARPQDVLANGQCIFVRRAAYESVDGHMAVRNEVLEDVRLAQSIRAANYKVGGAEAMAYLSVRMYTNGREVVEGLTKNAAAGVRAVGGRSGLVVLRLVLMTFGPPWLIGSGINWLALGGGVAAWSVLGLGIMTLMTSIAFWGVIYRRLYRQPAGYALLWPLGLLSYLLIALRSFWLVRSGRGVMWKGRTYTG